jgi:hypothetical protein
MTSTYRGDLALAQEEGKKCEKLKKEIRKLISECQRCDADKECFLDDNLNIGCPFGCYFIRSQAYDDSENLALIRVEIEKYNSKCDKCIYDCDIRPKKQEIGCRQGKCIDLRYYSKKQ